MEEERKKMTFDEVNDASL